MSHRETGRSLQGLAAFLLIVAVPVAACSNKGGANGTSAAASGGAPPSASGKGAATATDARLRGSVIVRSDSALIFVACGNTTERRLAAPPRAQLMQAMEAVNGAMRDSAFVDVTADTAGGVVTVRETHFASTFGEGSPCDRPRALFDWDAKGNEPFWRVTVDSTQVVLERPEPPRELVFDVTSSQTYGTLTTIIATRTLGRVHELKLGLLREACRDGMSDNWYPYRAELRIADVAMHGCATRGNK